MRTQTGLSRGADGALSVMMPVYNEERTLAIILEHVLDRPEVGEVIAVDDGSTDRSWEILSEVAEKDRHDGPPRHPANSGQGTVLRAVIDHGRFPSMLFRDPSLGYAVRDLLAWLERMLQG